MDALLHAGKGSAQLVGGNGDELRLEPIKFAPTRDVSQQRHRAEQPPCLIAHRGGAQMKRALCALDRERQYGCGAFPRDWPL